MRTKRDGKIKRKLSTKTLQQTNGFEDNEDDGDDDFAWNKRDEKSKER